MYPARNTGEGRRLGMIEQYKQALLREGKSQLTVEAYETDIRQFLIGSKVRLDMKRIKLPRLI